MEIGYGAYPDKFMVLPSISIMYLDEEDMNSYAGYYLEFSFLFLYLFFGLIKEDEENE